jgi:hypothetical protein
MIVQQVVTTVLNYLNAAGYYKSSGEVQDALNLTSLDLYKRLRGNLAQYRPGMPIAAIQPEQTNVSSDAISELYRILPTIRIGTTETWYIDATGQGVIADIVESIEIQHVKDGPFYPVNVVPDNQYLMMLHNPVITPIEKRPLGRMQGLLTFEIVPSLTSYDVKARVLTLPTVCEFTFVDSGGAIPDIVVTPGKDLNWSEDKIDNLVYGTIAGLGFNLSNGVLVQAGNSMNDKQL